MISMLNLFLAPVDCRSRLVLRCLRGRVSWLPVALLCATMVTAGCGGSMPVTQPAATSPPAGSLGTPAAGGNTDGTTSSGSTSWQGTGWKTSIGIGVSISPPAPASPGHRSPGAAVQGLADAVNSGHLSAACPFFPPRSQSQCMQATSTSNATDGDYKNFALGYVVIDGTRALVGSTGTFCQPGDTPECVTNTNPAALLDSGQGFTVMWTETLASANTGGNAYTLVPCIKIGTRWYVEVPSH